jgi:Peptidase family M48
MRQWMRIGLMALIFSVLLGNQGALGFGGPSKTIVKETVKEFNTVERAVRPGHLLLPINYVEFEGQSYGYYLTRRFQRLARGGERFVIKDTKYKNKYVRFEFESTRKAKVVFWIYATAKLDDPFLNNVVPAVLHDLFDFGAAPRKPPLVGNSESEVVHLAGCNHLPPAELRIQFATPGESQNAGYRLCPACFTDKEVFPIEDYIPLRTQAVEGARQFELTYPPINDEAAQRAIQARGESVLDNFPVEIHGFDYSFKIVQSEFSMASSFWSGFVYVTDNLMALIENDAELEFILAHEVAHAEWHPPASPYIPSGDPLTMQAAINSYYSRLRYRENEADLMAMLHVLDRGDFDNPLHWCRSALAKLQFVNEQLPTESSSAYATHPSLMSRVALLNHDNFELNPTRHLIYGCFDKNDQLLISVKIIGKGKDAKCTYLYLLVETTDMLNNPVVLRQPKSSGEIKDGNGDSYLLRTSGFPTVAPPSSLQLIRLNVVKRNGISNADYFTKLDLENARELKFRDIKGADYWRVIEMR